MDDRETPSIKVDRLTDAQTAMLTLLGNPPEVGRRVVKFVHDTPAALTRAAPGIGGAVIKEYDCPVVEILGARRTVLPNGDLATVPSA
ncbi:hypothetical protein [Sphingomonas sp.]|uniref:hypothetical protein n=1 Tax=Sphingomonas sp. TaxID=28214 RepID=UPI003F6FD385